MTNQPTLRDSELAFDEAIKAGRLSTDPTASNYAGSYMYMGTCDRPQLWHFADATVLFKNINSRRYDV
jgi:hypothetical protein